MKTPVFLASAAFVIGWSAAASAQDDTDALAKSLANPVAAMISVPFVFNADFGQGPSGNGTGYTLNVQPVIPFEISDEWTVISRTVVPIKYSNNIFPSDVFGLGDTVQSFFFTPAPTPGAPTWGIGPVFMLPTATSPLLGTEKWGAGPTGLLLVQPDPWTVGILANHIWSFAGDPSRGDVSLTLLQPFLSYSLGGGQSLTANVEANYDWIAGQWTAPLNLGYSKVFRSGTQTMSWQFGGKYYLASPANGPTWGLRTGLTLLFPQK